jgi:hypothetical protein
MGGGSTGGRPAGGNCGVEEVETKALPPIVEFLIDTTGSMNLDAYPNDPARNNSKWMEMKTVLPQAFANLPVTWALGVSFFNLNVAAGETCYAGTQAVPIAPNDDTQLGLIATAINAVVPVGATPTMAAWHFALNQISTWPAPTGYESSSRSIVLITDGIPTITNDGCYVLGSTTSNGQDAITEAEYNALVSGVQNEGTAADVGTFVIGVLGSENPQGALYDPLYKLTQIAVAGNTAKANCTPASGTSNGTTVSPRGTYCHFDMTADPEFATGLSAALAAVSATVPQCTFEVPPAPPGKIYDPNGTTVTYITAAGVTLPLKLATSSACTDGQWYISAKDANNFPTNLELCKNTCDTVARDPGAKIKVGYQCIEQL